MKIDVKKIKAVGKHVGGMGKEVGKRVGKTVAKHPVATQVGLAGGVAAADTARDRSTYRKGMEGKKMYFHKKQASSVGSAAKKVVGKAKEIASKNPRATMGAAAAAGTAAYGTAGYHLMKAKDKNIYNAGKKGKKPSLVYTGVRRPFITAGQKKTASVAKVVKGMTRNQRLAALGAAGLVGGGAAGAAGAAAGHKATKKYYNWVKPTTVRKKHTRAIGS